MNSTKLSRVDSVFTGLVVLLPILNIYSSGMSGLGLGDFLLIISVISIFFKYKKLEMDKVGYWAFFLYLSAVSIILTLCMSSYSISETITKLARFSLYTLVIFSLSRRHFSVKLGLKIYVNVSFASAVYLLIQAVVHRLTSVYLPITFPFLRLATSEEGNRYYEAIVSGYRIFGFRYSGFFKEPATFCQYVIVALIILLFVNDKDIIGKHKIQKLLVISIAVIMSFSAMGYVLVLAIWALWIIHRSDNKKALAGKAALVAVGLCIVFFISFYTGAFESMQSRIIGIGDVKITSGNMRLLRGFEVYIKEPFFYKVFGIGAGNFSAFMRYFHISTRFDPYISLDNEYMSGISTVLVYGGIVGLVMFLTSLIKLFKAGNAISKTMLVIVVLILFSSSSFFSANFVMPMTMIYAITFGNNNNEHAVLVS